MKMKKLIATILTLGMLLVGIGAVQAASLAITANVVSELTMVLTPTTMSFDPITPGTPSTPKTLTATTTGNEAAYQLQLTGAAFTGPVAQAVGVLQFKETADSTYKNATAAAQNMLATNGTADADGDAKTFDVRLNFPASAPNGTYSANITVTAAPSV